MIEQLTNISPEIITVTVPQQKTAAVRRQSLYQAKSAGSMDEKVLVVTSTPSLIPTSHKGTSLLLSNNPPKQQQEVRKNIIFI